MACNPKSTILIVTEEDCSVVVAISDGFIGWVAVTPSPLNNIVESPSAVVSTNDDIASMCVSACLISWLISCCQKYSVVGLIGVVLLSVVLLCDIGLELFPSSKIVYSTVGRLDQAKLQVHKEYSDQHMH